MSEIEVTSLIRILGKQDLEDAIIYNELKDLMDNYGVIKIEKTE